MSDKPAKMRPEEIVAFKHIFNDAYGLTRMKLIGELCSFIAVDILTKADKEHKEWVAECEAQGDRYASNHPEYKTREDFAFHVGYIAVGWAMIFENALAQPGSEWPEDISGPEKFANWYAQLGAEKAENGQPGDGTITLQIDLNSVDDDRRSEGKDG